MVFDNERFKLTGRHRVEGPDGKVYRPPFDHQQRFTRVYHITHLPASRYLLDTGRILSQLVNNESKLSKRRVKVIWLSPNSWVEGSIYGNVCLSFDINALIRDKRFYAVEVVENYNPPACRILITDVDHSGDPLLEVYDPTVPNTGPWHIDESGNHIFHGGYNIEFMLEGELSLAEALRIDFVTHHRNYCNIYGNYQCPARGKTADRAQLTFLAYVISNGINLSNLALHDSKTATTLPFYDIADCFEKVLSQIENRTFEGAAGLSSDARDQLGKSVLNLLGHEKYVEANKLSKAFASYDELKDTVQHLFGSYFDVPAPLLSTAAIAGI